MTSGDDHRDGERSFVFTDIHGILEDRRRLELIRATGLLASHDRPALDAITHLAARIAEAKTAMVSIVQLDRQVFASVHAPQDQQDGPSETPISHSFCQYVVMNDAPLVVADARSHPVLSSHPAVLEDGVVAYAGFPVRAPGGEVLGALCVTDLVPRTWTSAQLSGLKDLAMAVDTQVALLLSQRELHLDHERLMHVLDGAAHTLIIIADGDGVIRTMNRAAEDALRPGIDAVETMTISDLVGARPWRPEGAFDDAQDWTVLQHGELRVFSVRVSALYDPTGEIDGYIVVGDDVSARRQAEELLRDTVRKQAEAVEVLETLDVQRSTFIATASHELRTPVTSILGYTELLADGEYGELSLPQRTLVGRLVSNGQRLQHLIEDLLSLGQFESGHVARTSVDVDVNELGGHAWDSLQPHLVGRDLRTTMEVLPDMPDISGDPVQLERALLNLLTNAVKFTPDGGAVRLSVRSDPQGVSFEVSDSGSGISQDDHDAVFEPFFRTSDAHANAVPGSGIGLAVVRRIVESHGGKIALNSGPGQGTKVRFTIPVEPIRPVA